MDRPVQSSPLSLASLVTHRATLPHPRAKDSRAARMISAGLGHWNLSSSDAVAEQVDSGHLHRHSYRCRLSAASQAVTDDVGVRWHSFAVLIVILNLLGVDLVEAWHVRPRSGLLR